MELDAGYPIFIAIYPLQGFNSAANTCLLSVYALFETLERRVGHGERNRTDSYQPNVSG